MTRTKRQKRSIEEGEARILAHRFSCLSHVRIVFHVLLFLLISVSLFIDDVDRRMCPHIYEGTRLILMVLFLPLLT